MVCLEPVMGWGRVAGLPLHPLGRDISGLQPVRVPPLCQEQLQSQTQDRWTVTRVWLIALSYIYIYEIAISFYINSIYYIVNRQEVSSEHNRKGGSHSYCWWPQKQCRTPSSLCFGCSTGSGQEQQRHQRPEPLRVSVLLRRLTTLPSTRLRLTPLRASWGVVTGSSGTSRFWMNFPRMIWLTLG